MAGERDDLVRAGVAAGEASFRASFGRVPDKLALLAAHAPGAFAGYGLMRDGVMRDVGEGGALDLKTKELVFCLLDCLIGQTEAAKNHAAAAMRRGLTVPELAEGLVQVLMVGGITTWNRSGAEVLAHAEALATASQIAGDSPAQ